MGRENMPSELLDRGKIEKALENKDTELAEANLKGNKKKASKILDEELSLFRERKLVVEADELNRKNLKINGKIN